MKWLDSTTDSMVMSLSKLLELVKDTKAWHATVHGVAKSWTQLNNSTELIAQSIFHGILKQMTFIFSLQLALIL